MFLTHKLGYTLGALTLLTGSALLTMPAQAGTPVPAGTPVTAPTGAQKFSLPGGVTVYTNTPAVFSFAYNTGSSQAAFVGTATGFTQTSIGN